MMLFLISCGVGIGVALDVDSWNGDGSLVGDGLFHECVCSVDDRFIVCRGSIGVVCAEPGERGGQEIVVPLQHTDHGDHDDRGEVCDVVDVDDLVVQEKKFVDGSSRRRIESLDGEEEEREEEQDQRSKNADEEVHEFGICGDDVESVGGQIVVVEDTVEEDREKDGEDAQERGDGEKFCLKSLDHFLRGIHFVDDDDVDEEDFGDESQQESVVEGHEERRVVELDEERHVEHETESAHAFYVHGDEERVETVLVANGIECGDLREDGLHPFLVDGVVDEKVQEH